MVKTGRYVTVAELAALCLPPDAPDQVEFHEHVLVDEQVAVLSRTACRRCVFHASDDGRTYAVEYEVPLGTGDFETSDDGAGNHGWHGGTMEASGVR
ncbi:hypothetical protein [Streptomyces sp. NPDC047024]|uniref:hypothetical protein n=1 Tax=Streptomyces sp. NPDC047024 TaxID=3155476 RepID=UPI0033C14B5C